MATKAKRKRLDTVEAQLDALRAEKRQLVIQLCSIPVGSNVRLQEAIESLIVEVNSQIERKEKQLADIEMPTPVKSNCTPDDKNLIISDLILSVTLSLISNRSAVMSICD